MGIIVAGCGSGSGGGTDAVYRRAVERVASDHHATLQHFNGNQTYVAAPDLLFGDYADAVARYDERLRALTPPTGVSAAHGEMSSAVHGFAVFLRSVAVADTPGIEETATPGVRPGPTQDTDAIGAQGIAELAEREDQVFAACTKLEDALTAGSRADLKCDDWGANDGP